MALGIVHKTGRDTTVNRRYLTLLFDGLRPTGQHLPAARSESPSGSANREPRRSHKTTLLGRPTRYPATVTGCYRLAHGVGVQGSTGVEHLGEGHHAERRGPLLGAITKCRLRMSTSVSTPRSTNVLTGASRPAAVGPRGPHMSRSASGWRWRLPWSPADSCAGVGSAPRISGGPSRAWPPPGRARRARRNRRVDRRSGRTPSPP